MQRGFIQIPILIAVILTAVLGGGAYVAYEVATPSQNTPQEIVVADTTLVATTTEEATGTTQDDESKEEAGDKDSVTYSLQKQIVDLSQKISVPKTEEQNTVSSPKTTIEMPPPSVAAEESSQQPYTISTPSAQNTTNVQISSTNITPTITTVKIEWQTDEPTESKIFISGGVLSSKAYNSESGFSTRHSTLIDGLNSNTDYSYEIEAIAGSSVGKKSGNFKTTERTVSSLNVEFSQNNAGYFGSNCEPVSFSAYTEDQAGVFLPDVSVTFTNPETGEKTTKVTQESNEGRGKVAVTRFSYTPQARFAQNKTQTAHFSAGSISTEKSFIIRQTEFEEYPPSLPNFDTERWDLVDMATTTYPNASHAERLRNKGYAKDTAWFSKRAYDNGGAYMYFDPDTGMCI